MSDAKFLAAAVQMAPVYHKPKETLCKIIEKIEEAASKGAQLIVFPELIQCAYPILFQNPINVEDPREYIASGKGKSHYEGPDDIRLWETAEEIPGYSSERLCEVAEKLGLYIVYGLNERASSTRADLYNTSLMVGPAGEILGRHRKICPVAGEQLIHMRGDVENIRVFPTELGILGMGICWEHLNALFLWALGSMGEEIHCALWTSAPGTQEVIEYSSRAHAMMHGTYVVAACQVDPPDPAAERQNKPFVGGSFIVNPRGKIIARSELFKEEIIYAEIDLSEITKAKSRFSAFGKDSRDDILELRLRKSNAEAYETVKERKEKIIREEILYNKRKNLWGLTI